MVIICWRIIELVHWIHALQALKDPRMELVVRTLLILLGIYVVACRIPLMERLIVMDLQMDSLTVYAILFAMMDMP